MTSFTVYTHEELTTAFRSLGITTNKKMRLARRQIFYLGDYLFKRKQVKITIWKDKNAIGFRVSWLNNMIVNQGTLNLLN